MVIKFEPIGIISTPFKDKKTAPIQPGRSKGAEGIVALFPQYKDGLKDLGGFSHIYLLFHFHKSEGYSMHVTPYLDDQLRGLFATRSPNRPCGIGLSIVRLMKIEGNKIYVKDVDMLDGSPLLDIKPYVDRFDKQTDFRIGWLKGKVRND